MHVNKYDDLPDELMTARLLVEHIKPSAPNTTAEQILDLFVKDKSLMIIPVVEGGLPVGVIHRSTLVEQFARPFTRELLGKKPIETFMEEISLLVDVNTKLAYLGELYLSLEAELLTKSNFFILTNNNLYEGVGSVNELLRINTERSQQRLFHLAHHDALTGLPNRLLFMDRLNQAAAQAVRSDHLVGLMILDMDRFKSINDTFGHAVGDELLVLMGIRIKACIRSSDTVARLGGDEFVILISHLFQVEKLTTIAKKILTKFQAPFMAAGQEVFITPSIGISIFPFIESIDELIVCADTAMYEAKHRNGNNFQFYASEMSEKNTSRIDLESALRRALKNEELVLYYQPQIELKTGKLVSVEALVRWMHPDKGLIPPSDFIPLAEETGLIVQIGEWVIKEACRQLQLWKNSGQCNVRIAVNVSARQLYQANFYEFIKNTLHESNLQTSDLELEITESSLMQNAADSINVLKKLHNSGICIAIDDFGTGYSSLSYLKRFPISRVKIDRSFINEVTTDMDDAAITIAIIAMAKSLNIDITAEGVETQEQLQFLCEHDCNDVQGFLISKPIPANMIQDVDPSILHILELFDH